MFGCDSKAIGSRPYRSASIATVRFGTVGSQVMRDRGCPHGKDTNTMFGLGILGTILLILLILWLLDVV